MVVFWVTVPLMVLAVAWATGVVLVRSVREDRRLRAQGLATGHAEMPEDDITRVVVESKPAFEGRTKDVVHEGLRKSGGPAILGRTDVTPASNDRHVVVSVPRDYAHPETIEGIVNHLSEDESVEDVKVISPKAPSRRRVF